MAFVLSYVPTRPDYATWIAITAAVFSALPETEALGVLKAWSPPEAEGEYEAKSSNGLTRKTIGTLVAFAEEHGYDASAHAAMRFQRAKSKRAVRTQLSRHLTPCPSGSRVPSWSAPDLTLIEHVAGYGAGLADLWDASPLRPEGCVPPHLWLRALFGLDDPFICLAKSGPGQAVTRRLSEFGPARVAKCGFIVPSVMTGAYGTNQKGERSLRCLDNTGPRMYLVVEFDFAPTDKSGRPKPEAQLLAKLAALGRGPLDLCANLLLHLVEQGAPLALAVHSGGKSVHGWFPTNGLPDSALRQFFDHACRLGADRSMWTRCQLGRLPEGQRVTGERQQVYFCNPQYLRKPDALHAREMQYPNMRILAAMRDTPAQFPF